MRYVKGPIILFMVFIACAVVFVWLTSSGLPNLVASHFGASGVANGFMPRTFYIRFMLTFVIGLPTLMVLLTWMAINSPRARINLPHRDYWLAPERRARTIATLRGYVVWFGILLITFLCYAHWLVVRANESQPAHLSESWFIGGLVSFLAALFIGLMTLLGRFRNPI